MADTNNQYKKEAMAKVQKELGVKNPMAVPRLVKIVVNSGVKDALSDKKNMERAVQALTQITGQKPKVTTAKKSIATFKLRQGDKIGVMITLRGKHMYDFFEKLTTIVLPRIRDFHGVKTTSFDSRGNYTLGFSEHIAFPEIDPGKIDKLLGLEVVIVTTAKDKRGALVLLSALGMPFQKEQMSV